MTVVTITQDTHERLTKIVTEFRQSAVNIVPDIADVDDDMGTNDSPDEMEALTWLAAADRLCEVFGLTDLVNAPLPTPEA